MCVFCVFFCAVRQSMQHSLVHRAYLDFFTYASGEMRSVCCLCTARMFIVCSSCYCCCCWNIFIYFSQSSKAKKRLLFNSLLPQWPRPNKTSISLLLSSSSSSLSFLLLVLFLLFLLLLLSMLSLFLVLALLSSVSWLLLCFHGVGSELCWKWNCKSYPLPYLYFSTSAAVDFRFFMTDETWRVSCVIKSFFVLVCTCIACFWAWAKADVSILQLPGP